MSRKLPLCVECGMPLSKVKGRIVSEWHGVKGRPMFSGVLRVYAARGENRVSLTNNVTLEQACADADRIDADSKGAM